LAVLGQLEGFLIAVASVALLLLTHYFIRETGRKIGRKIARPMVRPLRPILTVYYRRKVIKQMRRERKAKGLPPLENPYTH
jgi:hypothetical protein